MNKFNKMTISSKITLIYTCLFSVVLIIISCFIIGNTWIYYNSASKNEMEAVADKVENYILSGGEITRDSLKNVIDNKYIEVRVTTRDNDLNEGTMDRPDLYPKFNFDDLPKDTPPNLKENHFSMKEISQAEYMINHRTFEYNGKMYNIQVFRLFNHEQQMINIFLIVFLLCNIAAVFVAFIFGRYISKKMLKPIRDVTAAADNISINDLQQRIEVPEADDEIRTLIVTFNDMITRLEESFNKQKQFISDASHELKTPIAVIQGYVNLIDRWGKSDEAILKESIDSIKSETEHMNNLVQQLLFLARADNNRGSINKENISLNSIAEDVLKDITVLDENIETKLIADKECEIYGDMHLIRQLMWIFCENAIKYKSDKPLEIIITVGEEAGSAYFSIKDNGIGIDEKSLPYIFDRFFRADQSRNKTIEGNGLGLSIADWIIKTHKASIEVKSKLGEGSEFIVKF